MSYELIGIGGIALVAVRGLVDLSKSLTKRRPLMGMPGSGATVENGARDAIMRELGSIVMRLDGIESEIKINRERYHDLAGVLTTVAGNVKLLMEGRIRTGHS